MSTSVLALAVPAQADAPEFVDHTGFRTSSAHHYAAPQKRSRGGWGLDYHGMSAHDPNHSRVLRLSDKEQRAFVASASASPEAKAQAYINHHARALGIEDFESAGLQVVASHTLSDGGSIVQLRQQVQGIEVFGPQLALLINAKGELVTVSGSVHTQMRILNGRARAFARSERAVMGDVIGDQVQRTLSVQEWSTRGEEGGYRIYLADSYSRKAGLSDMVRTKPLLIPTAQGLEAAYFVEFADNDGHGEEGVMVVARASDSRVLFRKGLTHSDSFKYRVWARDDARNTPTDNPRVDYTPHPEGAPNKVKPGDAALPTRLVEMEGFNTNPQGKPDPWLAAGATVSTGNNVDAYTDRDQYEDAENDNKVMNDGFTEGDVRAEVSSPGVFDYEVDLNLDPGASKVQKMAAVTQVFYTNNWLHDYWYDLGWDEKSGNAQTDNYGRGGKDKDPLLAQAQDSADSGQRNNANMTVYPDGRSPRMQMYLWDVQDKLRTLTPTTEIEGFKPEATGSAAYGEQKFKVTAQAVLVEDTEDPVNDGCQEPKDPESVKGKIVLVKIGFKAGEDPTCKSIQRAAILQKAGAVGMIFMDNTDRIPGLGGDWPEEVTLPALSINVENRDLLLAAMENGPVELTMERDPGADLDGSIDNQVVAHEWGHYAHLRLVKCGGSGCYAMSEGWADFFALHMSLREGDDFNAAYPLAVHASSGQTGDPYYYGLRRYPYSVNKKINPLMFHHISDEEPLPADTEAPRQESSQPNSEIHNAGEVWAQVLLAVEHELHEANKSKDKPLSWDGVHRLMGEYMIAGMKLTPAQPTWTEQRDAMLAVARSRDEKDFAAMVKGFASRGMGSCMVTPPVESKNNQGAKSSQDITGVAQFKAWSLDDSQSSCDQDGYLDLNERGNLNVSLRNAGLASMTGAKVEVKSLDDALVVDATGPMPVKEILVDKEDTIAVPVRLVKALKKGRTLPLEIIVTDENSCQKSIKLEVKPRVDLDEVPASTDMETFESKDKAWTEVQIMQAASNTWDRISETSNDESNFLWKGRDLGFQSDSALVSPAFEAADDEDFSIEFEHAYSFEASEHEEKMVNWDGGLIEYTIDDGKTWLELKDAVVNPEFNGVIGVVEDSKNPLTGRDGYVGVSPGYPARSLVRLDFRRNVAGKKVKIRFRIGTDAASGAPGWLIDNLRVKGVKKMPFTAVVADACDAQPGEDTGGDSGTGTGGETGNGNGTGTGGGNANTPGTPPKMGCGCASNSAPQSGWMAGLALLSLGLLRRRKKEQGGACE